MNISKTMLIHSAIAYPIVRMNADRQPVFDTPVELKHIWIDFTDSQMNAMNGKLSSDSGTLFFDCVNSEPKGFEPVKNMRIEFDGQKLTVNSVKKCYGMNGVEHFECGVS